MGVRATARPVHTSEDGSVWGGVVASFYCLMLIVFATRKQGKEGEIIKGEMEGGSRKSGKR